MKQRRSPIEDGHSFRRGGERIGDIMSGVKNDMEETKSNLKRDFAKWFGKEGTWNPRNPNSYLRGGKGRTK